jgi:hypothetical protein
MILDIETGQEGDYIVRKIVGLTAIRKELEIPMFRLKCHKGGQKKMFLKVLTFLIFVITRELL